MGASAIQHDLSSDDYLAGELVAERRHEYVNGQIYAMVGVSDRHEIIALNLAALLRQHLRGGPCQVFMGGVKLHLRRQGDERFYYPDLMVACDPTDRHSYYRERPTLLVEILSPGTERTDRGEKAEAYQRIPSLAEYWLLAQDQRRVEVYRRSDDWRGERLDGAGPVHLAAFDLGLELEQIYEGVEF